MTPEEIQSIFFIECEESLGLAEAGLAACQAGTQDDDTVNAIFRAVHSIKGGAGAFGFDALQAFTHCFETLLSDVRDGTVAITPPLVDLMLRALDTLSDHVTAARENGQSPDDTALLAELTAAQAKNAGISDPAATADQEVEASPPEANDASDFDSLDLDALLDDIAGVAPAAEAEPDEVWQLHLRPHAGSMRNGGEPLLLLRELSEAGAQCRTCDSSALPPLAELDPFQGYLGWTFDCPAHMPVEAVKDMFDFGGDDWGLAFGADQSIPSPELEPTAGPPAPLAEPQVVSEAPSATTPEPQAPAAAASPAAAGPQTIRIDLTRLDRLIDTVGELVIAQAMLAQRLSMEGPIAANELAMLESLTRDIQEGAMAIRAQPIGSVFSRVPRTLRELTQATGKQVRLVVSGETTELDKTVIERLGEPLTHLIRNAVDHGIESAEVRVAAGKPAEGTLSLSAEQRSGRILIRIADDGAGINRERVLQKAIDQGIVSPEASLTKEEIDHLIFAPGFSTAQQISNISGRGVGMDVVRQNVKELGGRITIESEPGKGTAFVLTLPLTLAISDGMIVNVGDQTLVVPLAHVVESLRARPEDVNGLGSSRQMLNIRGRFLPIIPLGQSLGVTDCTYMAQNGVLIVVDTEAAGQAALLVDAICDQRQLVIKSLDSKSHAAEGVAGATILGDGRVALILDVDAIVAQMVTPVAVQEAA